MHDQLIFYINSQLVSPLKESEKQLVREVFKPKKIRKHQFFIEEGEVCSFAGFVIKGALKQYTVDSKGKEDILGLFVENWWAGDRESFTKELPTPYFIEAVEETNILMIHKKDYIEKLQHQSFITELMRVLTERQSLHLLRRIHNTKTLSAELKFADLEKTYPEFLQRFPQHMIASYLGMTKETLSRIRSNNSKIKK